VPEQLQGIDFSLGEYLGRFTSLDRLTCSQCKKKQKEAIDYKIQCVRGFRSKCCQNTRYNCALFDKYFLHYDPPRSSFLAPTPSDSLNVLAALKATASLSAGFGVGKGDDVASAISHRWGSVGAIVIDSSR